VAKAGKQGVGNFHYIVFGTRSEEIGWVPELLAHRCNGIGKGGLCLGIPGSLTDREVAFLGQTMRQQGDDREESQQDWRSAGDREVGPLTLGLDSQMSSDFLKGHLHLPAPEEPLQNFARLLVELGAEQSASFEFAQRISHQDPTDGYWRQARVIPDSGTRSQFYQTLTLPIPVIDEQPLPLRVAVVKDLLQRRQSASDEPWPTQSTPLARPVGGG
jgi:hypothetical protein